MLHDTRDPAHQRRRRPRPRPQHANGRSPQRKRTHPVSHGERFTHELPPDAALPTAFLQAIASRLDQVELPHGTTIRVAEAGPRRLTIFWENTRTQHAIQLNVKPATMQADYEYSMVCEEDDELLPFPDRPLGSVMPERIDLNLNRQGHWTWLGARIKKTGRPQ